MRCQLLLLALGSVSLAAPQSSAPPAVKITRVASGGSGCPQGSIDASWTDSNVLPIYFTQDFTAKVGTQADVTDSRKNCQINLSLAFTAGYSFSLVSADYSGWGELDSGITGVVKSTYYFSGDAEQTATALLLAGPFRGQYYKNGSVGRSVWSACGGSAALNVNSEVALTPLATSANGVLAQTRESARVSSTLYLQWRKC